MRRLWIGALWIAASSAFAGGGPPAEYRLEDVVFRYVIDEELLGSWGYALSIDGSGKGVYHEGTDEAPLRLREFQVEPEEVFALLERCYRTRLFELEDAYGSLPLPTLHPNGMIQVLEVVVADVPRPVITVRIGAYSKTIRYDERYGSPPESLLEIAKRLRDLAEAGDP